MKTIPSIFLFVLCLLCGTANAQNIVPQPQQVEQGNGTFTLTPDTKICTNLKGAEKKQLAQYLAAQPLFQNHPLKKSRKGGENQLFLQILPEGSPMAPEAYHLEITPNGILVQAATATGLFYGAQSLIQLAEHTHNGRWTLPEMSITDAPRFAYRGFMIDVSRHFRSVEFLKKQMDAMAHYKLNRLHLHLTDAAGWRIEIKKYPRLTEFAAWRPEANWKKWWSHPTKGRQYSEEGTPGVYGGYYTQDEIRDLVRYAQERHITLIPEIEMPAHSEETLAAYPDLSCAGEPYKNADFCVGNEATFGFLEDVLTEVMELFPSEYIHVGGDEAAKQAWPTCPKCQKRMKDEGMTDVKQLQSYLIHRMEVFLNSKGRKLLGWDEIMEGGLAPNATVMSWRGEEGGLKAAQSGHQAIMTPGGYCYFDQYQDAPATQPEAISGYLPLSKVYSYDPIPATFTPEQAGLIYGVQANLWAEYIETDLHYEYMIYPRLLALSEIAWTQPKAKNYERFRTLALRESRKLKEQGYNVFDLTTEVGDRPESKQPTKHLALGKKVTYNDAPYNSSYPAAGDAALTDGIRGSWTYGDGRWQGFISRNRLDVTVDLESDTDISSVSASFMQQVGPDVFLPGEVIISVSPDGENFTELSRRTYTVTRDNVVDYKDFGWTGSTRARYVRYQARSAKEVGGWLFTDEIVIR